MKITPVQRSAIGKIATGQYYRDPASNAGRQLIHRPGRTPYIHARTLRVLTDDLKLATVDDDETIIFTNDGRRIAIALGYLKPPKREE